MADKIGGSGGGDFETANINNKELLRVLEVEVVGKLDLAHHHQAALADPDFKSPHKLREVIAAAKALERFVILYVFSQPVIC